MTNKKGKIAKKGIAVIVIMLSLFLIAYPLISVYYNKDHQSLICADYVEQVNNTNEMKIARAYEDAQAYNEVIRSGAQIDSGFDYETLSNAEEKYIDLLNLSNDGIMGYIEIPKINVKLPIFHGTSDATLSRGIGHLLGSSLPVGGKGTHSVLTAHSGMASQKMFSDLPALKEGDIFFIHVLNKRLAYRVDQILITRPEETSALAIEKEKDLCTLITCYPFGVNTHRLLVRGERVEAYNEINATNNTDRQIPETSAWQQAYLKAIIVGLGSTTIFALLLLLKEQRDRKRKKNHDSTGENK